MGNMNDNESILAELRRIGAWADMQRKITKWSFIVMAVLIPAMIVFGIVIVKREAASMENTLSPQKPEGHQRLASAYLAAGKAEQARQHYAQAFQLFPSEENEKLLIAIDKRIKQG